MGVAAQRRNAGQHLGGMDTMIVTEIVRKFPDLATRRVPDHLSQFTLDFSTSQLENFLKRRTTPPSPPPTVKDSCDHVRIHRVLGKFPAKNPTKRASVDLVGQGPCR